MEKNDIPTEHEEQREFVKWFRQHCKGVRIIAIQGVSAGVPDLFIPEWNVWIEMKRKKGGVISPEQTDWIAYLRNIGYLVLVCKGAEVAKEHILEFCNEEE